MMMVASPPLLCLWTLSLWALLILNNPYDALLVHAFIAPSSPSSPLPYRPPLATASPSRTCLRQAGVVYASASTTPGGDGEKKKLNAVRHTEITATQRKQAAALYEDPRLLTHDRLNEIFRPLMDYNDYVIRSMFTAGCIFRMDGVLVNTFDLQCRIWEKTAQVVDAPPPQIKSILKALHYSPEGAIKNVFKWTQDEDQARQWSLEFDRVAMEEFQKEDDLELRPDARDIMVQMGSSGIPCAVLSNLPLEVVEDVLNRTMLWADIDCIQSYDNKLKTEDKLLLQACLEMERPPKHTVFFDFTSLGIEVAHRLDMLSAAVDTDFPVQDFINDCDVKLASLRDWTLPRFRQLVEYHPFDESYLFQPVMIMNRAKPKKQTVVGERWRDESTPADGAKPNRAKGGRLQGDARKRELQADRGGRELPNSSSSSSSKGEGRPKIPGFVFGDEDDPLPDL